MIKEHVQFHQECSITYFLLEKSNLRVFSYDNKQTVTFKEILSSGVSKIWTVSIWSKFPPTLDLKSWQLEFHWISFQD